MKPLTIKVETLAKIGLGVLAIELATDMGKASMLRMVKKINSDRFHGLDKIKLKIVRGMCKACIED